MNFKLFLSACLIFLFSGFSYSQKIKQKGDLSALKNAKKIELVFTYDNMRVGKYEDESVYVEERVQKRNEKEPGSGDKWRDAWFNDREERFEPQFHELFNNYIEKSGIKASEEYSDATVKAIIHTTFTEPGFNVGVVRKSASIDAEIIFIDKKTGKEIGRLIITKVPGRDAFGYDFDTGLRIQEAYAMLGKSSGKYIYKKVLK